jgi:hypothetical protein
MPPLLPWHRSRPRTRAGATSGGTDRWDTSSTSRRRGDGRELPDHHRPPPRCRPAPQVDNLPSFV